MVANILEKNISLSFYKLSSDRLLAQEQKLASDKAIDILWTRSCGSWVLTHWVEYLAHTRLRAPSLTSNIVDLVAQD